MNPTKYIDPDSNANPLICPSCAQIFKEPRVVSPCGHSFCKICIDGKEKCGYKDCGRRIAGILPNLNLGGVVAAYNEATEKNNSYENEDRRLMSYFSID